MGARDTLDALAAAGITVSADGDRLLIRNSGGLTDAHRQAIRSEKQQILAILAAQSRPSEWTPQDVNRFAVRHAKLVRLGYSHDDADKFAERLTLRDQDGDDRVVCALDCSNYRAGRCQRSVLAGIANPLGGIAFMLQRCPAAARNRSSQTPDPAGEMQE